MIIERLIDEVEKDFPKGTGHHHRTADPCVRCPSCTNSSVSSSSSHYNAPTCPLTKQVSEWTTPRQTTFSRSSNSDRWPPSGTAVGRSHRLQKSLRHSGTQQRLEGLKLTEQCVVESHFQPLTKLYGSNEHQCTMTLKANTSISSEETSKETHSVHSCSSHSCSRDGVRHAEHDPNTNLSNLRFADDILLNSGSLKHTTTVLDELTTATTARACNSTPRKPKSSPIRHQSVEEAARWQFKE